MNTTLTTFLISWLNSQRTAPSSSMCDFDGLQIEIQPCDIILVEGRSRISEVIKTSSIRLEHLICLLAFLSHLSSRS